MNPVKPPLGIEPQWLWLEKRLWEVIAAMNEARLHDIRKAPTVELLIELHDLTARLINSLASTTKTDASRMTATEVNDQLRSMRFGMSNLEQWNEIDRQADKRMRDAVHAQAKTMKGPGQ